MNKEDKTNYKVKHVTLKQKEGKVLKWYHTSKKSKMKRKI